MDGAKFIVLHLKLITFFFGGGGIDLWMLLALNDFRINIRDDDDDDDVDS